MPTSKELKNIPISISLLHEQEYDNICFILKLMKNKPGRRRAFSERSSSEEKNNFKTISVKSLLSSSTLKDK